MSSPAPALRQGRPRTASHLRPASLAKKALLEVQAQRRKKGIFMTVTQLGCEAAHLLRRIELESTAPRKTAPEAAEHAGPGKLPLKEAFARAFAAQAAVGK